MAEADGTDVTPCVLVTRSGGHQGRHFPPIVVTKRRDNLMSDFVWIPVVATLKQLLSRSGIKMGYLGLMRKDSQIEQYEIFIISAAIAAQANYFDSGFRQRDLKFLIDMFSNWMDYTLKDRALVLHNTQIKRYLDDLVQDGYAKAVMKQGQPAYKLTRAGLFALLQRLVTRPPQYPIEYFYYICHVLETYKAPVEQLAQMDGPLPPALKLELGQLLDIRKPLETYLHFLEFEVKKLSQRIKDNEEVIKIVRKLRSDGKQSVTIVEEIEKKFPYDMNSQKPLAEFYKEIPERMRDFILDVAIEKRRNQIWVPSLEILEKHLSVLREMKKSLEAKSAA